ncbi:hypothetical protein D9756_005106 [Leucocoprinus leucothites]|uniref:FMN hydroxy acid dehydrogenase domain-containing protein n=1 Tax=Leucocoprinus leucothites TaxID=201217 RepID=A0A8H5G9D4_9AGAR|nr:hypothetical protein D9756_005106 [Leucoagaricus leucothites]
MSYQPTDALTAPGKWSSYMLGVYTSRNGPQPLGTVVFEEIEEKAKEKLKEYPGAFMYAAGNAGTHQTYRANRRAFEKYSIIPRMLVESTFRDIRVNLFGKTSSAPLVIAPIGVQSLFHPEGEIASAKAAQALGIPYIMSSGSSRTTEEVAVANGGGERWYQLYWPVPGTKEITESVLTRAKAAGFTALVVTLDATIFGWRTHDLNKSYAPGRHGLGAQIGISDPVFMGRFGKKPITQTKPQWPYQPDVLDKKVAEGDEEERERALLGAEWAKECNTHFKTWGDLEHLREFWDGPLILKGIQHVTDAERVLEYGVDGIVVSNHGGRQLDGAIPSLCALERICKSQRIKEAQRLGRLTVLFDSGVRTGPDMFKALALGAQAILLGRPWLYGMILGGQAGLEQVIRHTLADFDNTLALSGYPNLVDFQGKANMVLMKLDF